MAFFSVSYDLVAGKDYKRLTDRLSELDSVKVQLSYWLVAADNTAQEVFDHLADYVDSDDRLMVIGFTKRPSYANALKGTRAWLDAHF